jgi:hypothetical protein
LFGLESSNHLPLDPGIWDLKEKLNEADNEILCKPFTVEEIKYALFQMERNKAAGPDSSSKLVRILLRMTSLNYSMTSMKGS